MVPSLTHDGDLLLVSGGSHLKFSTMGFRLAPPGKEQPPRRLWKTRRAVPNVASPVLHRGIFFTLTDGGIMTAYEPETGEIHWQERLDGEYYASLVAGDGKVYALDLEGKATVLRAAPEFEVVAESMLEGGCRATPALARGRLIVRTTDWLYCFEAEG